MNSLLLFSFFLACILSLPVALIWQFKRYEFGLLVNPLFYFSVAAYSYMVLPSSYLVDFTLRERPFPDASLAKAEWFSCYYYAVILCFFLFSRGERINRIKYNVSAQYRQIVLLLAALGALTLLAVAYKFGDELWSYRGDRVVQNHIAGEIVSGGWAGLGKAWYFVAATVLAATSTTRWWLVLYTPPILLGILGNTRTDIYMVTIFILPALILRSGKVHKGLLAVLAICVAAILTIRGLYGGTLLQSVLNTFSEGGGPRRATILVMEDYLGRGQPREMFSLMFARMIPNVMRAGAEVPDSYVTDLARTLEATESMKSHVMGSPVAEAYYYGGMPLVFLAPFAAGGFYLLLLKLRLHRWLSGLLFIIYTSYYMYIVCREGFVIHFPKSIYMFSTWYLPFVLADMISRRRAFISVFPELIGAKEGARQIGASGSPFCGPMRPAGGTRR